MLCTIGKFIKKEIETPIANFFDISFTFFLKPKNLHTQIHYHEPETAFK